MDSFEKQSYEQFTITGDFSSNMEAGETITDQSVEAVDKDGGDVAVTVTDQASVAANDTQVSVLVRAGLQASSPYKITFKCTTSAGHRWELDVKMKVKEQ